MSPFRTFFLLTCTVVTLLGAWFLWTHTPPSIEEKSAIGGEFSLTNQWGKRVHFSDFRGKYPLVFFGYTQCPDVCPATLQVMTEALTALGDKADRFQPVFITIAPERDTPEVLAEYIKNFHPKFQALTGSSSEIKTVQNLFRVFAEKRTEATSPEGVDIFDHSSIVYLFNKNGIFMKPISYTTDPEKFLKTLDESVVD